MNKTNTCKAVVFDLGDTLTTHIVDETTREDDVYTEVRSLFLKTGYSIPEVLYRESKIEMWKNWKEQSSRSGEEFSIETFLHHLLHNLGVKPKDIEKFILLITNIIYKCDLSSLVLTPSVEKTLEKLRQMSYLLGIISNTSYSYDHIFEILDRCQIANYFDVVLVSSREKICKPNPKIFQKALHLLQVSAGNTTFVGNDPQVDIEGAKRAGMKTILVVQSEDELTKFRSNNARVVANVEDILRYLKE
ncbi:hypothetical protein LCGC14_2775870 [marine sediment metagenome]|uniref:HAD family hydrolase n=1 Tax=marine sediment metagenome TaxID=412755 RepID=A0A0F8YUQ5_9ZZZZ|nr:HAD family hydrolase [bacterium]